MSYKYILALDPSGNYHEGKGTTGWCIFSVADKRISKANSISAKKHECMETYWDAHLALLKEHVDKYGKDNIIIIIEDYLLYASKAADQINSKMETPKLIGLLQWWCYKNGVAYHMQPASLVKKRWSNDILHYKGYIKKEGKTYVIPHIKNDITRHSLDAVRHAVHYFTFHIQKESPT